MAALPALAAYLGFAAGIFRLVSFGLKMSNRGSGLDLGVGLTNLVLPTVVSAGVIAFGLGTPIALVAGLAVAFVADVWQSSYDMGSTASGLTELLNGDRWL